MQSVQVQYTTHNDAAMHGSHTR